MAEISNPNPIPKENNATIRLRELLAKRLLAQQAKSLNSGDSNVQDQTLYSRAAREAIEIREEAGQLHIHSDRNRGSTGSPVCPTESMASNHILRLRTSSTVGIGREDLENPKDSNEQNQGSKVNEGIIYNAQQNRAIELALSGASFCLTGPAGSGKTTTVKGLIAALVDSGKSGIFQAVSHKHLPSRGVPGIVVCGYTNKAVSNVKSHLSADLYRNCVTIHKLLEYEPVYTDIMNPLTGTSKSTMRFVPQRDRGNPNPAEITTLIIEEASMVSVDLWNTLIDSFPTGTHSHLQIIFIGDIQQLPPVFGKSVFIHAMSRKMETVELTEVYRTALESPIISLAHRILSGSQIAAKELDEYSVDKLAEGKGKVFIHKRKHKIGDMAAVKQMGLWLPQQMESGAYDPATDIILTPYNVNFGAIALNSIVATKYARMAGEEIWEIYTGINKLYFRVGERVLYNKSEATIIDIKVNKAYYGKIPRKPSKTFNYDGVETKPVAINREVLSEEEQEDIFDYVDSMLQGMGDHTEEGAPTARAASHIITVKSEDTGIVTHLSSAGDLTNLLLGYAITVHKSQGSEYRRVFFITHKSQNTMLYRELIYTACTRAKEELYVICEPDMFVKGINTQRYPGRTIQEKIASFDRAYKISLRSGKGNVDQIPVDLDRFIVSEEEAASVENVENVAE